MYPCSNCGELSRDHTRIKVLVQHPYPEKEDEWEEKIVLVCKFFEVTYVS